MKKPKGIDNKELAVIINGGDEVVEVSDWEEACSVAIEQAMEDQVEAVIVVSIARVDYTPAHAEIVEA